MSMLKHLKGQINQQVVDFKLLLGVEAAARTEDRTILEQTILSYCAKTNAYQRILFVGCQWYTKHYERRFAHKEYWTIELEPQFAKYGARHHVIDSVTNLSLHFQDLFFDVIVYNGVFGWGINTQEDAEIAFEQCFRCLRSQGLLVFGWNNTPELSPFLPETCPTWDQFQPFVFPPLATSEYSVTNRMQNHTFRFLIKP